jgi:hypothetical protein
MTRNTNISDKYDEYESEGRLKNLYLVMMGSKQKPEDDDFDEDGDYVGPALSSVVHTLVVRADSGKRAAELILREYRESGGEYYTYKVTDVAELDVLELSELGDFVKRHSYQVSEAEFLHFISTAALDSYLEIAVDSAVD